jgi:hypothetical protein
MESLMKRSAASCQREWFRFAAAAFALATVVAVLPSAAEAQMSAKPGLWESTMTMSMAGMPQLTPEQLEKMKAAGMKMPMMGGETKAKSCVTKEEIEKFGAPQPKTQQGCELQYGERSATKVSGHIVCSGKMTATGDFTVTIVDPNHTTTSMKFDGTTDKGRPIHMQMEGTGTYLGPDCGSVKPGSPEIE